MAEENTGAQKKPSDLIRHARTGLNIYYYGKGKGKTTAAMGLAARAAGAGMNVFILQFVKAKRPEAGEKRGGGEWPVSSEIVFFENIEAKGGAQIGKIENAQAGIGFVGILGDNKEKNAHVEAARAGAQRAKELMQSDAYDLLILDELISALELGLLSVEEVLELLAAKPKHLHIAYTGHDYFEKVGEASDLVSEINMVKHPYYKGILAQRGIDF